MFDSLIKHFKSIVYGFVGLLHKNKKKIVQKHGFMEK